MLFIVGMQQKVDQQSNFTMSCSAFFHSSKDSLDPSFYIVPWTPCFLPGVLRFGCLVSLLGTKADVKGALNGSAGVEDQHVRAGS